MRFTCPSRIVKTWKTASLEELNNKTLFNHDDIWTLLEILNENLKSRSIHVELKLFGGAAICITLGPAARESTRDIDAIYDHRGEVDDAVNDIALEHGITPDWLEWISKGLRAPKHETFQHLHTFSNLTVYTAAPEYILVQKLFSKRPSAVKELRDLQDIRFIWEFLNKPDQARVQELWAVYFPARNFPEQKFLQAISLALPPGTT